MKIYSSQIHSSQNIGAKNPPNTVKNTFIDHWEVKREETHPLTTLAVDISLYLYAQAKYPNGLREFSHTDKGTLHLILISVFIVITSSY